jgi:hypothetical protein
MLQNLFRYGMRFCRGCDFAGHDIYKKFHYDYFEQENK